MKDFEKEKREIERNSKEILNKVKEEKVPRLVQPQSGEITNINHSGDGDIYIPDVDGLKAENKCLKKAIQEKERVIAILKEEIELLKGMIRE